MPRKRRLEYEGAVYHVISRGNYRAEVFTREATKAAFLKCLDEACGKAGWVVHAWCIMSNHYHLCLQTPRANLVSGMKWLQSTFAIRFNRLRDERGHLFQGRYKALPVAPEAVGPVCHYIHLNPVRARLVAAAELPSYRWTSVTQWFQSGKRPPWLELTEALSDAGGLADTSAGRRKYVEFLGWLQEDEPGKKELCFERMSKDWAVGTRAFKKELIKAHGEMASHRQHRSELRAIAEEFWGERLAGYLRAMKKQPADIQAEPKGAAWKVVIAAAMKQTTTASNPWLAQQLRMGSPFRLSRLVTECRRVPSRFQPHLQKIAKCKV